MSLAGGTDQDEANIAFTSIATAYDQFVSPEDVEILYHYTSGRTTTAPITLTRLNAEDVLTPVYHNENTVDDSNVQGQEILGGLYNLKLTAEKFSELGVYTLHLRPKQIRTSITDCGVLASLPSVRGLVIDLNNVPAAYRNRFTPQGLVGYRIEYINTNGTFQKIPNFYRVVTSSFYCQPIVSNLSNSTDKAIRYQYTDQTSNLVFLTITPSSSPSSRPNVVPFIGQPGQNIILTNTFFNPTTIEIDMVQHDASTLAHALYGNQTKAITPGIYTIYDNDNNIYKQYNLYEIKDEFSETLYEVREERTDIDETLNLDNITNT
jgi:hypothetical protein